MPGHSAAHTGKAMSHPAPRSAPPTGSRRDIAFTRVVQSVERQLRVRAAALARWFHALGLITDLQSRPTPRGLSTFLALAGPRGLICIIDFTLVDGMAVGLGHWAMLDIRLLDERGDVVADGLAGGLEGQCFAAWPAARALLDAHLARTTTSVFVATLGYFELMPTGVLSR